MKRYEKIKKSTLILLKGNKCRLFIGKDILEGCLVLENSIFYVLHNDINYNSSRPDNMYGYDYSWMLEFDNDGYNLFSAIEIEEPKNIKKDKGKKIYTIIVGKISENQRVYSLEEAQEMAKQYCEMGYNNTANEAYVVEVINHYGTKVIEKDF